ncbi:SAP domain-containing ribonucleoprotein isoform X2 [Centruroides vittatus]|uniref:SAP domain-containing ribonucleoprotein isoform X2 n=1 Tax=Centruroides vittatus TaxID=120091 RepID=UPI00350F27CE
MADTLGNISSVEILQSMKVAELKKELKLRGLTVTGNKNDLVERLQTAIGLTKDQSTVEDRINSDCLEALENLEGGDDVNEDEVLSDDVLYGEEQKGSEPPEINEEEILSPITTTDNIIPVKNTVKLQRKPLPIVQDTLQNSNAAKLQRKLLPISQDSIQNSSVTVDNSSNQSDKAKEEAENENQNGDSVAIKKVIATSTKNLTQEQRLALRAKKFSNSSEKLKLRAERFGSDAKSDKTVKSLSGNIGAAPIDLDCLKKRAERFGQNVSTIMKEIEEKTRILKRKERFGVPVISTESNEEERKRKRAERFNLI